MDRAKRATKAAAATALQETGTAPAPFVVTVPNGGNLTADELADCLQTSAEAAGHSPHPSNIATARNLMRQWEAAGQHPLFMMMQHGGAYGFGRLRVHVLPDWTEWRHIPQVDDWQAVALSLNIEPKAILRSPLRSLGEFVPDTLPSPSLWAEFSKRLRIVRAQLRHPEGASVNLAEFAAVAVTLGWSIPTDLRSMKAEPPTADVDEAARFAEIVGQNELAMPPEMWAYWLAVELVERNSGNGFPSRAEHEKSTLRAVAEGQIMHTFEAQAATLPLRQVPTGLPWPKGQPLPPKWCEGLYMERSELRAWAAEYTPDLLGSALLLEPMPASAEQGSAGDRLAEAGQHQAPVPEEEATGTVVNAGSRSVRPTREGAAATGGVVFNKPMSKRAQLLDAEIEAATQEATDGSRAPSVYAVLQRYAEARRGPFLGFIEGEGCKYQAPDGTVRFFTLEALRKRMTRAASGR